MEFEVVKIEEKNITMKGKKGARESKKVFKYQLNSYAGDKATMTCDENIYQYGDTLEIKKNRSQNILMPETDTKEKTYTYSEPSNTRCQKCHGLHNQNAKHKFEPAERGRGRPAKGK